MMAMLPRIIIQLLPSGCLEKDWLFYDNVLTFSVDGGALKYKLDNGFYLPLTGTVGGDDACLFTTQEDLKP
jgi:hypothetical protein